jgi:hypothetical protein
VFSETVEGRPRWCASNTSPSCTDSVPSCVEDGFKYTVAVDSTNVGINNAQRNHDSAGTFGMGSGSGLTWCCSDRPLYTSSASEIFLI